MRNDVIEIKREKKPQTIKTSDPKIKQLHLTTGSFFSLRPITSKLPPKEVSGVIKIKQDFDRQYSESQQSRPSFLRGQLFLVSNDHVHFWDIPTPVRKEFFAKINEQANAADAPPFLSLFVADGDFLSWCKEDVPGDIIILDINQKLLDFVEEQVLFLRNLFANYLEKKLSFLEVSAEITKFYKSHDVSLDYRKEDLGVNHWLFSEENYCSAMRKLQKAQVTTININLFSKEEVDFFAQQVTKYGRVAYVNLTNLGDYDQDLNLERFLQQLEIKQPTLIQWNVHDRGFNDQNEHYCWYSLNITAFSKCYTEWMPIILADEFYADDKLIFCKYEEKSLPSTLRGISGKKFIEAYAAQHEILYQGYSQVLDDPILAENIKIARILCEHHGRIKEQFSSFLESEANKICSQIRQSELELKEFFDKNKLRIVTKDGLSSLLVDQELPGSIKALLDVNKKMYQKFLPLSKQMPRLDPGTGFIGATFRMDVSISDDPKMAMMFRSFSNFRNTVYGFIKHHLPREMILRSDLYRNFFYRGRVLKACYEVVLFSCLPLALRAPLLENLNFHLTEEATEIRGYITQIFGEDKLKLLNDYCGNIQQWELKDYNPIINKIITLLTETPTKEDKAVISQSPEPLSPRF